MHDRVTGHARGPSKISSIVNPSMNGAQSARPGSSVPITARFLLCVRVPFVVDRQGQRWIDPLWAKDLALHTAYLRHLTVAAPVLHIESRPGDVPMYAPPLNRIHCVELPEIGAVDSSLPFKLPTLLWRLWQAIGQADVVQAGFAGWPVPEGVPAITLARLRRRFTITFVESSFWRATAGSGLIKRALSGTLERLVRWSVRRADYRVFTSRAYWNDMLDADAPRAALNIATWIDEQWILSAVEAHAAWYAKQGPVRLLFAGRLIDDKGVPTLLDALEVASRAGCDAVVTLIGDGELRERCASFASRSHGAMRVRLRESLPYGMPFLELIRKHDAVLLPSLSDEQPRLPFDAFSQAVPVIGFDTGGLREVLTQGMTGRMARDRDPEALAELILWAAKSRDALKAMGMAARESAHTMTHAGMHARRHALYSRVLPRPDGAGSGRMPRRPASVKQG